MLRKLMTTTCAATACVTMALGCQTVPPQTVEPPELPPPVKAEPPRVLATGEAHANEMLTKVDWADPAPFKTFCDDSLARAKRVREELGKPQSPANTVGLFNALNRELDTVRGLSGLQFQVNPNQPVRDAAQACQQELAKFATSVGLDRGLYDALSKVDVTALDPIARRFVERSLRDFRRSGVDKDEASRTRLAAIDAELVGLSQAFSRNIAEDRRTIAIDDAKALEGLPADFIAAHPPGEDGKIHISTDYPDFFPFQGYVGDGELRKKLYREFLQRGFPKNAEVMKQVLALRKEKVTLLGYPHYAEYAIEDKMAASAATVDAFIKEITEIVRPRAERDVKALLARKRKDDPKATAIEVYDRFYYISKVREEQHDFDAKSVRPYFSYPRVKAGILAVYGELFGLTFEPVKDANVWHPTVDLYEMKRDGKLVGRFFLDMHPREGKYKHAAAFDIQTGLSGDRIPYASLVCNFPDPSKDPKALMEHNQVVTFFHEFGHLIHHLLARRGAYVSLAGFNPEWDFVEAPSQILEEWAWEPEVLQRFAKHVDTDAPIPAALVEKMKKADGFGRGFHLMRQVFLTAYSFFLHTADPKALDLEAFSNEMYAKYSPYPRLDGSKLYANFGHLMGYSAIYYTYQWSLAIAKDLFTRFEEGGIMNKEIAADYARYILEPGGTIPAAEMVENFLGRPRNLDAYKAWIQAP